MGIRTTELQKDYKPLQESLFEPSTLMECPKGVFLLLKGYFFLDAVVSPSPTRWWFQRFFLNVYPKDSEKKKENKSNLMTAHIFLQVAKPKKTTNQANHLTKKSAKPTI